MTQKWWPASLEDIEYPTGLEEQIKEPRTAQTTCCCFQYLSIYLAATGLCYGMWAFSCGMWNLVSWPEIKLRTPVSGADSFCHRTTREVPNEFCNWPLWAFLPWNCQCPCLAIPQLKNQERRESKWPILRWRSTQPNMGGQDMAP